MQSTSAADATRAHADAKPSIVVAKRPPPVAMLARSDGSSNHSVVVAIRIRSHSAAGVAHRCLARDSTTRSPPRGS